MQRCAVKFKGVAVAVMKAKPFLIATTILMALSGCYEYQPADPNKQPFFCRENLCDDECVSKWTCEGEPANICVPLEKKEGCGGSGGDGSGAAHGGNSEGGNTTTSSVTCEKKNAFSGATIDVCFEPSADCCALDLEAISKQCAEHFGGFLPVPYPCTEFPIPGAETDFRECAELRSVNVGCAWGPSIIACCESQR